jgi:hypothetical protein
MNTNTAQQQAQHSPLPWFTMANPKPDDLKPMVSVWSGTETRESIVCNSCSPADAKLIVASVNNAEALAEALKWIRDVVKERKGTAMWQQMVEDKARNALAQWEKARQ